MTRIDEHCFSCARARVSVRVLEQRRGHIARRDAARELEPLVLALAQDVASIKASVREQGEHVTKELEHMRKQLAVLTARLRLDSSMFMRGAFFYPFS